jgi:creatinine amidohydrolase/Fe(II)-dependent formamide hydrolase-like protein
MCTLILMAATMLGASNAMGSDQYLYEKMTPEQLKQAVARCPVAYLPTGIPEWHGEQNACGLDALKAETLGEMAASMLGGVCFPTVWTGPGGSTPFDPRSYPRGTVTIDEKLYQVQMEELLTRIEGMGFKVAVHLSGHYPGVVPKLAEKFNQRGKMKVISVSENQVVKGMPAGDHAAAWETSLFMVLRPGLTDLTRLPPLPEGVKPAGERIAEPYQFTPKKEYYGVYGADPRVWANKTYGRKGTETVLDGFAAEVGKALGDASYGRKRGEIAWPGDARVKDEVRYVHLLPYQWRERFEKAPVVYWPLTAVTEPSQSKQSVIRRAEQLARDKGGMVFPAFIYGPSKAGASLAVSAGSFGQIVSQVAVTLAGMGFRVIVLMPSAGLDPDCRSALAAVAVPEGQTRIVVADPADASPEPRGFADAVKTMLPDRPIEIRLSDAWMIDGKAQAETLATQSTGAPGEQRVYEGTFDLTQDQSGMSALLDLGKVDNLCEAVLNDSSSLIDHWSPYRFMVTGRLKPGTNKLKVIVRHQPQPTLDKHFYTPGSPVLAGPVVLRLWK